LISAGVRIFEYEGGFNHAKIICADGEIGIVGSTNLDYRSMHLNYEGGVLIYKSSVISEIYSDLSGMMLASREVEKSDLKKDLVSKLWFRILRLFSPFM
ncbi:MAG: cardiolipin synthase, partial [Clostridia bacterium]|nr:cardiolipin synthase [Clostridia bacterium]